MGTAYNANLATATGSENIVYTAIDIPVGMTLSADGKLTGTPSAAGEYKVKIAAWAEGCKEATVAEFTLKVEASGGTDPGTPEMPSGNGDTESDNTVVIVVCSVLGGLVLVGGGLAAFFIIKKKKSKAE